MYTLRPYQNQAVEATIAHFRKHRAPGVIVLPTGAGKSLVIAELSRLARGRVLVLAHVKELVEQNYSKFSGYGLEAGIYSAGLQRKESTAKVIFGSIQSVARAKPEFFTSFSLLIIDECHRVSSEQDTQYLEVVRQLRACQPALCVIGLTATPYRLGMGWIYQYSYLGRLRSDQERFFKKCVYEVSLRTMVEAGYLTRPVVIDCPVQRYDFSSLRLSAGASTFRLADVENLLKSQERVTPGIVDNIIELSKDRHGVMIFAASVRHAQEILALLPSENSALIVGETASEKRDEIVEAFKARKLKYLVNVSVLTTGFDAPHVDVIAILRPTESVSLYQQIVGRGLRLSPGKTDCLVLDYTGICHNIYAPEIGEDKPRDDATIVEVPCPSCSHLNQFWGLVAQDGEVIEHYGRKCRGAWEEETLNLITCPYRFRFKTCGACGAENDIAARQCSSCEELLIDPDSALKEAMTLKDAHVMRPDMMCFEKGRDKRGNERLEVRYFDLDANKLTEYFYLKTSADFTAFHHNFVRMHSRIPEKPIPVRSIDDVLKNQDKFRVPMYVIARKMDRYWKIREKIFL